MLEEIEKFVYEKNKSAWDWEVWGNVNYIPTVEEAIASGREDCDGQAIVGASMLREYGYDARRDITESCGFAE